MQVAKLIDQFLLYLKNQKRMSQHTVIAYRNDLYSFRDYLETELSVTAIDEISSRLISSHIASLAEKNLAASSLNRKISSIQSLFQYALKQELIAKNPAQNIKRPKTPKRLPEIVSADSLKDLIDGDWFENNFEGVRNRLMLRMFYTCGLRREELIGIQLGDINRSDHSIKVTGKRDKQRIIPISKEIISFIDAYLELRMNQTPETDHLFISEKGRKLYPSLVYKVVKKYLSLITTMKKRSPHVLRHSFATHLLNEGTNLQAIKELLGHSSLSATQVYTQTSLEKLKQVYNQAHPKSTKN